MDSISILKIAAGITSIFGFFAFIIAYFLESAAKMREQSVLEVIKGEGIVKKDSFIRILLQFQSDELRLKALQELLGWDRKRTADVLDKVKSKIDIEKFATGQKESTLRWIKYVGLIICLLALMLVIFIIFNDKRDIVIPPEVVDSQISVAIPDIVFSPIIQVPSYPDNTKSEVIAPAVQNFPDVPGNHFAASAVLLMKTEGIMDAKVYGDFKGDDPITRYDFAVVWDKAWERLISELPGHPGFLLNKKTEGFKDVPKDNPAFNAVLIAAEMGVLEPYPDGSFRGDRSITGYELAMGLSRGWKSMLDEFEEVGIQLPPSNGVFSSDYFYTDIPADHWAYEAVQYLCEEKLLPKRYGGMLEGPQPVTRYELAMIISTMWKRIETGLEVAK